MPLAVYVLGLAIFAQGTSELMIAGLLPEMAADLGVSVSATGLLISAFALGMLAGAPALAVLTLRWPRRTAMLTFLAVFVAAHVAGALTDDYTVLFGTRVVAAFVYAGFWAAASVTAIGLAGPDARGRAMAVVAGGLTVATIAGLPAGTVLGQHYGWRAAFWAVAALSVLAMIGVFATIPGGRPGAAGAPRLRDELRTMAMPPLWAAYATTALATSGLLATFGYLAPLVTEVTGLSEGSVPLVMALYGLGATIGITLGGRVADRRPFTTLHVGLAGGVVVSAGLALLAGAPAPTLVLALLLGGAGFGINPALNTRVFALAEGAPTLAAAVNISAFNVGITVGPWLGGLAIDAGLGYRSVAWIGAALIAAALVTAALAALSSRRSAVRADPAAEPAAAPVPVTEGR
ncbi:Cmx/CmrA family chloramphenicol efflux MFS transporter [Thermomonospora amylolytica]|uniref:Cmx/CmrA family chloramphenicol efflux MFS transporter n=1 Tax=Thermomonospora amylolytica TaxID=1411117 RepID=UPI000E6B6858|nr:Cmx/CmrA family chloramphenicol efflux MFS transporter [Thermomonospora amylolytica]